MSTVIDNTLIKNIVIVGGGFAGTQTAAALEKVLTRVNDKEHRIILVEKKSHFYHAIGGLRLAVLDWDNKIMIPYTNLFTDKNNIVVQATATQLAKNKIILDKSVPEFGTVINFEYLILATGTRYPSPAKANTLDFKSTHDHLVTLRSEVKAAQSIVIVGGGPVGIELAGEIRDVYKDTKITIVHDQAELLDSQIPKLRSKCAELLAKNDVDLILNDAIIIPDVLDGTYYHPQGGIVETKNGKSFTNVDLVLLAFGNRPDTEWLKKNKILSDNGYVKVKPTFQVDTEEFVNVFVLGDAADFNETKLAYRIGGHVDIVVKNVFDMAIKKTSPTGVYKKAPDAMFLTFGKNQGLGLLPMFGGIVIGSWLVSTIKSGSLFIKNSWKTMNLKEPVIEPIVTKRTTSIANPSSTSIASSLDKTSGISSIHLLILFVGVIATFWNLYSQY